VAGARAGADYHVGRAVRETYLAKLARLKYEAQNGSLIDAREAEQRYFELARNARNSLLALADRLGPEIAPIMDARECTRLLRAEFLSLCSQIAADPAGDATDSKAAAGRRVASGL
jgi:hypothetical protein